MVYFAVGEFRTSSFNHFATEDPLSGESQEDYVCYIEMVDRQNIHLFGVGNRATKIVCDMPDSGFPTPVSNLHPLLIKKLGIAVSTTFIFLEKCKIYRAC